MMRLMPTYKVIFTKPSGATRVVRVVAESPEVAQQKAGFPQNDESVEVTEEKYERVAASLREAISDFVVTGIIQRQD